METAYAAVVSVVHLMEQIKLYHARQPIFLDEHQRQLQSLHSNVIYLQEFLENYSDVYRNEAEHLEKRIEDAAFAVEDIIETHIVDDIQSKKKGSNRLSRGLRKMKDSVKKEALQIKEKIRLKYPQYLTSQGKKTTDHFLQGLRKVAQDMDFIKEEIAKIQENTIVEEHLAPVGSFRRSTTMKEAVVVFEDELNQIMDKLTRDESDLQVLPITGMGGIGKTTLAKSVYVNPLIIQHFDILGWITISQEYNLREILLCLLQEIGSCKDRNKLESLEDHELGDKLHKYLTGRRYLIIMDDMWSVSPWDKIRKFLPDNGNESRIIVTTRLSTLADYFGSSDIYKMKLLDETKSWKIFCKKVFVQGSCPPELEEIGKQIVKNCKGLPLSISVIGGLLANSKIAQEYWGHVATNISTTVNLEDDARCSRILSLSYNHLPIYLKPCFLHLGIFPEDKEIWVSKLIKLWVAEGFLRPPKLESLEEVAENCLKDLVDRNLIFVSRWGSTGNMKCFKIHDLMRDFCLREAQKKRFLCVDMGQNPNVSQDLNIQRRIVFHRQFPNNEYRVHVSRALRSASLARSLTCNFGLLPGSRARKLLNIRTRLNNKLLRILDMADDYLIEDAFQLVNTRLVYVYLAKCISCKIPSSICLLWNLQTLVIELCEIMIAPPEIWEMTQLRHLMISDVELSNPRDSQNDCVLENLQTLSGVKDLRWTDEILGKIPNIKKLKMEYFDASILLTSTCLNNFVRLDKLQSLMCRFSEFLCYTSIMNLEFPLSIKKLTLWDNRFQWEDIATKVGSLPNLEKLKLMDCYAEGIEWNPVDGKFLRLKYLKIYRVRLRYWRAEETHFPCLESLVLQLLRRLEEIPSGIGDIQSLQLIVLNSCSSSSIDSAKKILNEQQEMGNESFRLVVDDSYAGFADLYDLFDQEEEGEEEEETRDD